MTYQRITRLCGIGGLMCVCLVLACSVSVGPGGSVFTFTIAGRTFVLAFGEIGRIGVAANETTTVPTSRGSVFRRAPTDAPSSATMQLPSGSVGTFTRAAGKAIVHSQALPLSGSAEIRFLVAPGSSTDPCAEGVLMAEYDISFNAGITAVLDDVYELSAPAVALVLSNDVTFCLQISADFDADFTIGDVEITFGGGGGGDGDVTGEFNLFNVDVFENIHILLPGEDFEASNRLTPGADRTVTVSNLETGSGVTVRAGRNGAVLDTTTCPAVGGTGYEATATWDGQTVMCTATPGGGGGTPGGTLQVPIDSPGGVAVAVPPVDIYNGIDYAIVGVLGANTPDAPASPYPSSVTIDLASLGLASVERMYMAVVSAWVPDLPNGVTLATLTCAYAEGGAPTTMDFTLGSTTAEWSYLRPEHVTLIGGVQHDFVPVLYSFLTTVDSAFEYEGWVYDQSLIMDSSRTLTSCTLTAAAVSTFPPRPSSMTPVPTWAGTGILGVTLVGPAGASTGGDGETGTVTGSVVDAQSGGPLAGALVQVSGTGLSATTDGSGNFTILNVPAGGATLVASTAGYVETNVPVIVFADLTAETSIGMLAIGAGGDNVAVVFAWGENPRDLDLHMSGPDGSDGRFHIYYGDEAPVDFGFLDLDDTDSFGPETITVSPRDDGNYVAGDYHVWIHHFAGELSFAESSGTITLFAGGAQIAQYSVGSASGDSSERIWRVVEFSVSQSGAVSNVTVLQSFTDGSDGSVF